jgi:hypothetical protein
LRQRGKKRTGDIARGFELRLCQHRFVAVLNVHGFDGHFFNFYRDHKSVLFIGEFKAGPMYMPEADSQSAGNCRDSSAPTSLSVAAE